jgi:hypothetical protein
MRVRYRQVSTHQPEVLKTRSLRELLEGRREAATPGARGTGAGPYDLALLTIGGRVLIADASFIPDEDQGIVVNVPAGTYTVRFAVLDYGADWRVSRLLIGADPGLRRGAMIGRTWTDTGKTAICDPDVLGPAWGSDWEASYARIAPALEGDEPIGVAEFDVALGAVIPFVESGFGDGEYPVRELVTSTEERMGVEVQFIPPQRRYPT